MTGFRVYATVDQRMPLAEIGAHAKRAESLGFDGLNVPDAVHDGLLVAASALAATSRLHVATSVLIAFPRSPMTVAVAAWDLQQVSGGRFELGMGSQVRGNIVGRYGTPWTAPVPRMREYIASLRAIFECWQQGSELRFEGEHYQFTRMQPFFRPDPLDCAPPAIYMGAIGPRMLALAGESADGLMTHPTNSTPRYLREVILPRLAEGAARSQRRASECQLMVGPLVVTGRNPDAVASQREEIRRMLSFLYSTPSYWPSLALFGWQERGERLHALTRAQKWEAMAGVIDDEMLETLAPIGSYEEIPRILRQWYGGLTDWLTFPLPSDPADDRRAAEAIAELRAE